MGNANEKVSVPEESSEKEDGTGGVKAEKGKEDITKEKEGGEKKQAAVEERRPEGVEEERRRRKPKEKMDPMGGGGEGLHARKGGGEEVVRLGGSLKDRLSLKKRCRLNIPPCSRVPEPSYRIKLLIDSKYEGPFRLEMKVSPCEVHITGFEGVLLKRIRKRDIIFVQTMKGELVRMFIKSSEDQDVEDFSEVGQYTSQYLGEVMQIICKFLSPQDCESFEFFFSFIYGLIVHSDRVKIPVSDFIDFGEYVIGSSKHILKRLDKYKDLNDQICDENVSSDEENEEDLLDSYESKMIAQEREFFSRKNLELIYRPNTSFGFEPSGSVGNNNGTERKEEDEENERILKERQEKYSKFFPVSITGEAESGGVVTFKDISAMGLKYVPEVIEWRISNNIGGSKASYNEVPASVSKSFQINEDHVSLQSSPSGF